MSDAFRGMSGAMGGDAYRDHAEQAMHVANDIDGRFQRITDDWPFSDIDTHLAQRIVDGEYIGRHEGPLEEPEREQVGRYRKPMTLAQMTERAKARIRRLGRSS